MGIDPLTAGIIGGSSLISGVLGSRSSRRAADAQADASAAGIAEQRRQFDTLLGLTAPQRQVGNAALNTLAQAFIPGYQGTFQGGGAYSPVGQGAYGGPQYGAARAFGRADGEGYRGSFGLRGQRLENGFTQPQGYAPQQGLTANSLSEQFRNLPGAQFMVNEATGALQNGFAARGGALSGNALSAIADRTSNLASSTIFNGLGQLAGIGQVGTNTAAQGAMNQGNNVSNLLAQQGAARASGIAGSGQSINNAIQGGLSNYLLMRTLGQG